MPRDITAREIWKVSHESEAVSYTHLSHQLKALRLANLVKFRKEAQIVYYSLADDHVKEIIDKGFEHLWQK